MTRFTARALVALVCAFLVGVAPAVAADPGAAGRGDGKNWIETTAGIRAILATANARMDDAERAYSAATTERARRRALATLAASQRDAAAALTTYDADLPSEEAQRTALLTYFRRISDVWGRASRGEISMAAAATQQDDASSAVVADLAEARRHARGQDFGDRLARFVFGLVWMLALPVTVVLLVRRRVRARRARSAGVAAMPPPPPPPPPPAMASR